MREGSMKLFATGVALGMVLLAFATSSFARPAKYGPEGYDPLHSDTSKARVRVLVHAIGCDPGANSFSGSLTPHSGSRINLSNDGVYSHPDGTMTAKLVSPPVTRQYYSTAISAGGE